MYRTNYNSRLYKTVRVINLLVANSSTPRFCSRPLSEILNGTWRHRPPPLKNSLKEVVEIIPLLLGSGAAALGWWKIRHSKLRTSSAALQLQQAYREISIQC